MNTTVLKVSSVFTYQLSIPDSAGKTDVYENQWWDIQFDQRKTWVGCRGSTLILKTKQNHIKYFIMTNQLDVHIKKKCGGEGTLV